MEHNKENNAIQTPKGKSRLTLKKSRPILQELLEMPKSVDLYQQPVQFNRVPNKGSTSNQKEKSLCDDSAAATAATAARNDNLK